MDADYIADLEEEVRTLRGQVAGLEAELTKARENLNIALERKVEEVIIHSFLVFICYVYVP